MTGTNRVGTGAARQAFAPIVVLALGWSAAVARAQPAFPPPENPLHLVATRAAGPIVVDGRLAWVSDTSNPVMLDAPTTGLSVMVVAA